jgi:hypothetical protein
MQSNKKTKIKASSLHESVVSIAIISITISVGMMIFFNVTNNIYNQVSYHQLLNKIDQIKNKTSTVGEKKSKKSYFFKGYNIIEVRREKEGEKHFFIKITVLRDRKIILETEYVYQK